MKLVITVEGGVVSSCVSDGPIEVAIVDYDVEGQEESGLKPIPQGNGVVEFANAYGIAAEVDCLRCNELFSVAVDA